MLSITATKVAFLPMRLKYVFDNARDRNKRYGVLLDDHLYKPLSHPFIKEHRNFRSLRRLLFSHDYLLYFFPVPIGSFSQRPGS